MSVELGYAGTSAIVTGGTRGIGKAVVTLLLGQGAQVLAVGSRPGTVAALQAEVGEGAGDKLRTATQDMRSADCGQRLVADAVAAFGGIDLVVNNAAAYDYIPPDTIDRPDWQELFTLKALGYWTLARAAVPELARRHGSVVNVAGVAGITASPDSPHVGAVNAAVVSMTESMARALASDGVRVNVVSPGATDTDRFATRTSLLAERENTDQATARAKLSAGIPVGHPVDPAELALVVALLGAPALQSVTGAHVVVDGGSTLGGHRHA